ncbi:MAG: DUF4266 domain-containing protein [Gammaproteobacteria bacterium]|nr:DUF4266 domain-containing protein [Gammaproteobacteria bacterium]
MFIRICLVCALLFSLSGCGSVWSAIKPADVKSWHRDILAKDEMQLDANSMELTLDEKIYFAREASRGGGGFGGGGCGCN